MRYILLPLILFQMVPIVAQLPKEIKWSLDVDWRAVVESAKREQKFIFVECMATWCGPCKEMEKSVYSDTDVINLINKQYVSVKLQMDTTKSDAEQVKRWYHISKKFKDEYNVNEVPTFLFFDSNGELVHRGSGLKNSIQFLLLCKQSLNRETQFYTSLNRYRAFDLPCGEISRLAAFARDLNEEAISIEVARGFMNRCLNELGEQDFLTPENIKFMGTFYKMITSNDRIFQYYLSRPKLIDSIVASKGYSNGILNYVVTNENVRPLLSKAEEKGKEPNWKRLRQKLERKYNSLIAHRAILNSKVWWYQRMKNSKLYAKYLVEQVDALIRDSIPVGLSGIYTLNNSAYDVFLYSNKKRELTRALNWMDLVDNADSSLKAALLDTKANILYKLGRRQEAIRLQENAIALDPQADNLRDTLEKMRLGAITWLN